MLKLNGTGAADVQARDVAVAYAHSVDGVDDRRDAATADKTRTVTTLTIVAVTVMSLLLTLKFKRVLLINCRAQMSLLEGCC